MDEWMYQTEKNDEPYTVEALTDVLQQRKGKATVLVSLIAADGREILGKITDIGDDGLNVVYLMGTVDHEYVEEGTVSK